MFSAREGVQKKEKNSTFMKNGKTVRVVMMDTRWWTLSLKLIT